MNIAFIKSLYRASHVAFGSVDMLNEEILYSSGHVEKMLGYSSEELAGQTANNFESLVHPEDVALNQQARQNLINSKEGEVIEYILRVRKSDGSYLHMLIRDIVFERNEEKIPTKYSTIIQDVTMMAELESELARKVEALGEISYKNSHQLRAPVANIIGLVDLLKRDNFKTEYNEKIVRHLEETVKKLDQIIHEINGLSN